MARGFIMDKVEVNKHGVNKLIKATILSDEKMKEVGFRKNFYEGTPHEQHSPYWYFLRFVKFPKEKKWKGVSISFTVRIPKDGSDIDICVIDDDFCQPYPYQRILAKNPENECANIVKEQVEQWMAHLQDNGVLSGHVPNEYI